MVYLDYSATTPVDNEIQDTYFKLVSSLYGNPDSIHSLGVEANDLVEKSRSNILKLLNLNKYDVVFTSGASESNNLALKGVALAYQHKGKHIITTNYEHASVLNTCKQLEEYFGFEVTYLPVDRNGRVSLQQVKDAVREDTILVSIMAVNNEIGSLNPIEEISEYLRLKHIFFHVDFVQACGKIDVDYNVADLGTLSAHKIHGLKGSGVLFKKSSINLVPVICGGEQENGLRGGTNNAPTNIVFAKTLRKALESQKESYNRMSKYNRMMREAFAKDELIEINSPNENVSPFILNFRTPLGSEVMMNALEQNGFLVSARSTCASNYTNASHVLLAIGLSEKEANSSIRVSMQSDVKEEEIVAFIDCVTHILDKYCRKI